MNLHFVIPESDFLHEQREWKENRDIRYPALCFWMPDSSAHLPQHCRRFAGFRHDKEEAGELAA